MVSRASYVILALMTVFVTLVIDSSNLIPRPKFIEEIEYTTSGAAACVVAKLTIKSEAVPVRVAEYDT